MTEQQAAQKVEPHHGCCDVEGLTALHPQAEGSEWLRRTPMPPCRQGAHTGLFILVPLPNGAAMKTGVCEYHAELIENLYTRDDSTEVVGLMDWVSMIVGGSLFFGVMVTGLVLRVTRRGDGQQYTCECHDSLAMHDPKTGDCHGGSLQRAYNSHGEWNGKKWVPCACRQYIGLEPPDRIVGSFQFSPGESP